jgi:transketolase
MEIPQLGQSLTSDHLKFLEAFRLSASRSIISMVNQAQSGHPGGSLSCIDYLALIYSFLITQDGNPIIVSNGHVSPSVYATLIECGYIPRDEVINTFRQVGSIYEGHVTRHVPGVWYGTGPLGTGISAASGFALAHKIKHTGEKVFGIMGDGEAQEGQVYEMMHFASKYELSNFIVFMDYNQVQLTDAISKVMPVDFKKTFEAAGWHIIEVDGHNFQDMWSAINQAYQIKDRPTLLLGHTIMGKGVEFMEKDGHEHKATWHGKSPKPEECEEILKSLILSPEQESLLHNFRSNNIKWKPEKPHDNEVEPPFIDVGMPVTLDPNTLTDCRSAYGKTLLDLAKRNSQIIALTADLGGSVKTDIMEKEIPERVFDVGIAEQHMVSCSGGISLNGLVPFCSTFGTFLTSRPKDQARVNDINRTNVKMVATHCGLSVGEDGPTHQAIDDMGAFLGHFNTTICEPADPNQCDHIIRYIASHYGNFYVRMGRAKLPIITKENGTPFFDQSYEFKPGKADIILSGSDITILAAGPMVQQSIDALANLNVNAELIALSSIKPLDAETILTSAQKTGRVLTVEDHNPHNGYATIVASVIAQERLLVELDHIAVEQYQLSGKADELYEKAGLGVKDIQNKINQLIN